MTANDYLPYVTEAGLFLRTDVNERQGRRLLAARAVERGQADVMAGKGLAAIVDLHEEAAGILEIEHGHAEHYPVGVARVRVVGVLDVDRPAVLECVLDLRGDLLVGEIRQKRELTLRDAVASIGHHNALSFT